MKSFSRVLFFIQFFFISIYFTFAQNTVEVFVWEDLNGDGQRAGEPLLNEDVQLWNSVAGAPTTNTMIVPTFSGTSINFNGVPDGEYVVVFPTGPNIPNYYLTLFNFDGGNTQATDGPNDSDANPANTAGLPPNFVYSYSFTLTGQTYSNIGAGYFQPVSIGDFVWEDFNGNGIQDGIDVGLSVSVAITVFNVTEGGPAEDVNGNPIGTVNTTAGSGAYQINNLPPGTYRLTFSEPGVWRRTVANVGGPAFDSDPDENTGETADITLASGDFNDDIDAGYFNPVNIGNFVWQDMNGNGLQDGGEPGIAGVTVNLSGTTGSGAPYNDTENTNGAGAYNFIDVPPGNYTVEFILPTANHFFTRQDEGGDDDIDSDPDRANGEVTGIMVQSSDPNIENIDAGMFIGSTVGDFVWEDLNGNGIQDGGEPGLPVSVQINIIDVMTGLPAIDGDNAPAGPVNSTVGTGAYIFEKLWPGEYYVEFDVPAGVEWKRTLQDIGADNTDSDADLVTGETANFTLMSGDEEEDIDAGYFRIAKIGDFVWEDNNGDGLQDGGEPGIGGIPITLIDEFGAAAIDADGVAVAGTTSDGAGAYEFDNLRPGNYRVVFGPLAPYFRTLANEAGGPTDAGDVANDSDADQASGETHIIILTSDEEEFDIDAGYYRAGTIEGLVWEDCNANGIRNPGDDVGLPGWSVEIRTAAGANVFDVNGDPVGPQITDGAGMYSFMNLPPGDYQIFWTLIPPFQFTTPNVTGANTDATDVDDDSDATIPAGSSHIINLLSNGMKTGIDAGVFEPVDLSGFVFSDNSMMPNGIFDPGENAIGLITVELWSVTGDGCPGPLNNLIATQITDGTGEYNFMNLRPGTYRVRIDPAMLNPGGPLFGFSASTPIDFCVVLDCNFDPTIRDYDFGFYFECGGGGGPITQHPNCQIASENPVICNLAILDQFCGDMFTQNSPGPVPTPLCPGGGAPHNMSWFAFVAGEGVYDIVLRPFDCTQVGGNIGIQAGIYTDCTFSEAIFCQPGCSTAPISLPSTSLVPGETYYFFLDGCAGSVCSYEVDVTGNYSPYVLPIPTGIAIDAGGCDPICPGQDVLFTLEGLDIDIEYVWSVVNSSGMPPIDMVYPAEWPLTRVNNVTLAFPSADTYTICMEEATNQCETRGPICVDIVIGEIPDEIFDADPTTPELDPYFICTNNFDWNGQSTDINGNTPTDQNGDGLAWQGPAIPITSIGQIQTFPLTDACGCMYNQIIMAEEAVVNPPEMIEFILCKDELPFEYDGITNFINFEFTNPIEYTLQTVTQANGCDSIISYTAYVFDIFDGGIFELFCDDVIGGVLVRFGDDNTQFQNTLGATISYTWRDPNGVQIFGTGWDDWYCYFTESGLHTLVVTFDYNGKICEFNYELDFDITTYFPDYPELELIGTLCPGTTSWTHNVLNPIADIVYTWTWPADAIYISGQGTPNLILDWSNSTGGDVCVYATNGCGDGPISCDPIFIPTTIPAAITIDAEVCEDNPATLTVTSMNSILSDYIWDFGGGVPVGSGIGRGPHQLIWNTPGIKTVTLTVEIDGCFSEVATAQINVVERVAPPTVTCVATDSEVIFSWIEPNGLTSYDFNVVPGGFTGMQSGSTYIVSGLPVNTDVTLILTSNVTGPCGNLVSFGTTCRTQDCTPPTVTLETPEDSICLVPGILPLTLDFTATAADGSPATGTAEFIGNGIGDINSPVFNPTLAGVGQHQILYRHTDADGCIGQATVLIRVLPTPLSTFIASDDIICIKDRVNITYTGGTVGGALKYDFNLGTPTGPGVGPFPVRWTTSGTKTLTLSVEKDGCVSDISTLTVVVQDTLPNFTVSCIAQGLDFVEFSWPNVANSSGYSIVIDGGAPIMQTGNTYRANGLAENQIVTIFVTAISNTACPNKTASETCQATACPPTVLDISPLAPICFKPDAIAQVLDVTPSGNSGIGTPVVNWNGPGIVTLNGVSSFDPLVAGVGTHVLNVSFLENGCLTEDSTIVLVNPRPIASFTGDTRICVTDQYIATYNGSMGTNLVYNWSQANTALGGNQYAFTFTTPGTFNINLSIDSLGCDSEQFSRSVIVEPELSVPSTDSIKCSEFLDRIEFTWGDIGCASSYRVFVNGVVQGIQTNTGFISSGLIENEAVNLTIEFISDCECGDISISKECIAKACPPVILGLTPAVNEICVENITGLIPVNIDITGNDNTGVGVWSGSPFINPNGQFDPVASGVGTFDLAYTYTQEGCTFDAMTSITVNPTPLFTNDVVQPECFDDVLGLVTFEGEGGTGNLTFSINNNVVTGNEFAIGSGNHTIQVVDEKGCRSAGTFQIVRPSEPIISITGPTLVTTGTTVTYSIDGSVFANVTVDSVVWTLNGNRIPCPAGINCFTQTLTPTIPGQADYTVTVYFDDVCSVNALIRTTVQTIVITTFPNIIYYGAGQNGIFKITTNDPTLIVKTLKIYDRWGELLFEANDYNPTIDNKEWRGDFKGKPLQPGVYVYMAETVSTLSPRSRTEIISGDVTIIH